MEDWTAFEPTAITHLERKMICSPNLQGITLRKTNIAPEQWWLWDYFLLGARPIFRGERLSSGDNFPPVGQQNKSDSEWLKGEILSNENPRTVEKNKNPGCLSLWTLKFFFLHLKQTFFFTLFLGLLFFLWNWMKERTGRSGRFLLVDGRSHLRQKMTTQKIFQVSQKGQGVACEKTQNFETKKNPN